MTDTPEYRQELEAKRLKRTMNRTLWIASIFALLLPICYLIWFGVINNVPPNRADPSGWGSFGDFIGGLLNPVVAFLALFWLTRSIAIQREELRDTKAALEKANAAQLEQAATLEKQRFEDTFFALVDQHNKVLDQLNAKTSTPNSFSAIDSMHWAALSYNKRTLAEASARFKQDDDLSGHYFRILFQILKLVATRTPGTTLGPVRCPQDQQREELESSG